jgi:mannose-binding lectin 2
MELTFQIHGEGSLHGDGMAIWVTKDRAKQGPVFGSMDRFEGLGLFIDTYKNNRPGVVFPYVMAMLGNSSVTYDKDHDGLANELAGCSARGLRAAPIPTKIRLTYYAEESLKVELQYQNLDEWTPCFETGPIALPPVAYLGFSAETGELHDNHDIIALETFNMHVRDASETARAEARKAATAKGGQKAQKGYKASRRQKSRGWWWFFLKMIIFFVVVVGAYVGYTMYRASRRGSRF